MNDFFSGTSLKRRADGSCELIGVIDHIRWESEDKTTVIAGLRDGSAVKGEQDSLGITIGCTYRFLGRYEESRHGTTFRWDTFTRHVPHDPEGVAKYLAELIPGVGPIKAAVLVDALGVEAASIIRETPQAAVDAGVLTLDQAEAAAAILETHAATEATRIDLFALIKGRGFSQKLIQAAIDKWGVRAAETIRRNPYLPMLEELPSAGFKRCDKLYLDLGFDPKRLKRQALCMLYALRSDSSGHTWHSADTAGRAVIDAVGRDAAQPVLAAKLLKRCKKISVRRDGSPPLVWIAEADKARNEWLISENLRRLMKGKPRWPQLSRVESISEHQAAAIGLHISASPVWMLLGTPGTGKTYTAAAIIKGALELFGRDQIAVAAPTGKASVRITAALAEYGVQLAAATIHRTLGVGRNGHDGKGWGFKFNWQEPLPQKLLIVDESSMLDTDLMAALLQACAAGTNILFCGDVNQLPPVGHGSPLRDMITAGVPSAELTEIRRNAGRIVHACRDMKDGKRITTSPRFDAASGENLRHFHTENAAASLETLCSILKQFRERETFDAIWEVQVLCAVNESSELSRHRLNAVLQAILNPFGATAPNNPFRFGDKIICLKNGGVPGVEMRTKDAAPSLPDSWFEPGGDPVFVANGDIGRVLCVTNGWSVVKFMYPDRFVKLLHGKQKAAGGGENGQAKSSGENAGDQAEGSGGDFDLAYAITTHKCVHPDTLVETSEGLLPIRMIRHSDGVIGCPNGAKAYKNFVHNPVGRGLRLTTKDGYSVTVTDNHKVDVWDGERFSLTRASNARVGDWVRLRMGITVDPATLALLPILPSGDVRAIIHRVPETVGEDEAEFFGLMVADGCVWERGFRLVKRHRDVAERFGSLCSTLFGLEPKPCKAIGATGFEVNSSLLAHWLQKIGGMSPNEKYVPECILRSPARIQNRFLRGLFEDGGVAVNERGAKHVEFGTCYEKMSRIVQIMLLRAGVACSRQQYGRSWRIMVFGDSIDRFKTEIGFVASFKQKRLGQRAYKNDRNKNFPVNSVALASVRSKVLAVVGKSRCNNAISRKHMSIDTASVVPDLVGFDPGYHYDRIKTIEQVECESMCVEVPDGHRFLQNGFPFGNSQGSESGCIIIMIDDAGGAKRVVSREWNYTAVSRAKRLCILIGDMKVFEKGNKKVSITRRKTFLTSLLTDTSSSAWVK